MTITKKIVCILLILHITYSSSCLYNTNSSCTANGCYWGGGFCSASANITNCLDGYYYSTSVNNTGCLPCTDLGNTTCSILCPNYDFVPGLGCIPCSLIDPNCISCQVIEQILNGINVTINTCDYCAVGYVLNPNDPTNCIPLPCSIVNCLLCSTNTTCGVCLSGYIACQNETACCPSNCTVPNCLTCSTSITCNTCQYGYTLNCDGICSPQCPTNCGNCTSPNSCSQCLNGYVFSSTLGYCVLMCQVQYCATCTSSTTCSACISGYTVAPYGTVCVPNGPPNCMIPSNPTFCQTCNPGYVVLANGSCGAAICYITNCLVCGSSTTCSQCNSISTLNSNGTSCIYNCLSVVSNCVACSSNTTCLACAPGYVINSTYQCNPACTIANCAVCLTSGICQYCKNNFTLSCSGNCTINCGIPHCLTCNSSTTCQTCAPSYSLSAGCTQCILVCAPGYYIATATNGTQSCQLCSLAIPNCYLCATSQLVTNPLSCLACFDFYYINGAGYCSPCSNAIANCLTCNSPGTCTLCANGYNLYTIEIGATFCQPNTVCNVPNCYYCIPTNSQICATCQNPFQKSSDGLFCRLINCVSSQIYDPITKQCLCPIGTYLINNVCRTCKFSNCLTCNSAGCNTCISGYFLSGNTCQSCPPHCLSCTSKTACTQCNVDFTLSGTTCIPACGCGAGVLVTSNGTLQLCPAGCSNCGISQGSIYCINPSPGYSFNTVGDIIKCLSNCLTCARANYTICTSCPGASILVGISCVGCVDAYAASCSPASLSTSCIPGYSVFNGTCQACDPNCVYCGNTGPGNCDYNQCYPGFVVVEGTINCTACYNGCSRCHQNNPALCLQCAGADYLDNSSKCQPCPASCQTCSTDTICTSCYPGFTLLSDGKCYNYIGYPCLRQIQSTCVSCYPGYRLSGSNCVINITCSTSSSCKSCPQKYYLKKGKCVSCQTNSLCAFCKPSAPSSCLTCVSGYYLDSSTNNCYTCDSAMQGCLNCTSDTFCTHAANGYYLQVDVEGSLTGNIIPCAASCDTCVSPTCLTCAPSYTRFGSFCLYGQYVSGTITLGPGPGTDWFTYSQSSQQTLAYAVANSNQIIAAILALAGLSANEFSSILLKGVGLGSIVIQYAVGVPPEIMPVDQLNSNLQTGEIPDFNAISHSTTINAKSTTNNGNGAGANLGLILGITIPLVILLVVVIIFIKIYSSDTDEKETEETDKGVNEYEM